MKIEELRGVFEGKTQLQVNAISPNYIGREIVIEAPIYDIRESITIFDSTGACETIGYNQERFAKQLLDYSKGTNVLIKAKLEMVSFPSYNPHLTLSLISITKA